MSKWLARLLGVLLAAMILFGSPATSVAAMDNAALDAAWREYKSRRTHLEPAYRFPHSRCFGMASIQHGLPLTLLLAVARGESDFVETARSRANAHGVMQILWPDTARHLGIYRLSKLYDPCTNIDASCDYFIKELNAACGLSIQRPNFQSKGLFD